MKSANTDTNTKMAVPKSREYHRPQVEIAPPKIEPLSTYSFRVGNRTRLHLLLLLRPSIDPSICSACRAHFLLIPVKFSVTANTGHKLNEFSASIFDHISEQSWEKVWMQDCMVVSTRPKHFLCGCELWCLQLWMLRALDRPLAPLPHSVRESLQAPTRSYQVLGLRRALVLWPPLRLHYR